MTNAKTVSSICNELKGRTITVYDTAFPRESIVGTIKSVYRCGLFVTDYFIVIEVDKELGIKKKICVDVFDIIKLYENKPIREVSGEKIKTEYGNVYTGKKKETIIFLGSLA